MKRIYLDNAATTPIDPDIIKMMNEIMKVNFGNPSSAHSYGREARTIIEDSRKVIADLLHTSPGSIFFTSGGTEANNMAIKRSIYDQNIKHAITSKIAHPAVLAPLQELSGRGLITLSYVEIDNKGRISLSDLRSKLNSFPSSFVSIMHANNEIGTIQDIKKIGGICREFNSTFHSDTVQTVGHYNFNMQELDVDFITASAHKFHGPKGVGFIYLSDNVNVKPLLLGGSQERNMRAGTENLHSIAGLAMAMQIAYNNLDEDTRYIKKLKSYMIERLKSEIPDIDFYANCTDLTNSLYTVLSVNFPKNEISEMLLFNLDIMGICCSGGSACSSGGVKGSYVFSSIVPNSERPGIRFSFSKYNTVEDIDYTIKVLKDLVS